MKCAEKLPIPGVWRGTRSCSREGSLEYEGKMWCNQHHPPTKAARRDRAYAEWRKRQKQTQDTEEMRHKALAWMRKHQPDVVKEWEEK